MIFLIGNKMAKLITNWKPEDKGFWATEGRAVARRNLWLSVPVGKASVFKFIADEFPQDIGAVSGAVGLAGGLGGFFLPIMFGALVDLTGIRSTSFMLLYGTVCVSLVWMYFSFRDVRNREIKHSS